MRRPNLVDEHEVEPRSADGDTAAARVLFDAEHGCGRLLQHVVRFAPGRSQPRGPGDCEETLFVLHSPPLGTRCDLVQGGHHVGSRAIRRFVEERRPPLVLSGHIHESPRVSGAWRDTLGRTTLVNPGQFGSRRVAGVWFDPARPGETLRHTTSA